MRSFMLDRAARSFRLEKGDEAPPGGGCGLGRHLSARELRRLFQWLLLLLMPLSPCLCAQGMVNVFLVASVGLTIDLLVYDPSWGARRTGDCLFAAARTALAAAMMT